MYKDIIDVYFYLHKLNRQRLKKRDREKGKEKRKKEKVKYYIINQ